MDRLSPHCNPISINTSQIVELGSVLVAGVARSNQLTRWASVTIRLRRLEQWKPSFHSHLHSSWICRPHYVHYTPNVVCTKERVLGPPDKIQCKLGDSCL